MKRGDELVCPSVVLRLDEGTTLRMTAYLGDSMVGVTTAVWPPEPVALIDWHTGSVRCGFTEDFADLLGELEEVLSDESVALYSSFRLGLATAPPETEDLSTTMTLRGVELAFACDLDQARVVVTTADRVPLLVGRLRDAHLDGTTTQFRLHSAWTGLFGDTRARTIIRRCAIRRWRAEDKRRRRSLQSGSEGLDSAAT